MKGCVYYSMLLLLHACNSSIEMQSVNGIVYYCGLQSRTQTNSTGEIWDFFSLCLLFYGKIKIIVIEIIDLKDVFGFAIL